MSVIGEVSGAGGIGAIGGGAIGAGVGLLGGPFAEVTVPGGALVGGIIGGLVGIVGGGIIASSTRGLLDTLLKVLGYLIDGDSAYQALTRLSGPDTIGSLVGIGFDLLCGAFVTGTGAAVPGAAFIIAGFCITISATAATLTANALE